MVKRKKMPILFFFAFFFIPLSITQGAVHFSLEPNIRKLFGHTTYHISFSGIDTTYGTVYGDSELEFPLDVWTAEAKGSIGFDVFGHREIFICGDIKYILNDPGNMMKDSDWISIPSIGLYDFKFSYSESEAEINGVDFDIAGGFVFLEKRINNLLFSLAGKIGYRRQKFDYDIIGIPYSWKDFGSGRVYEYNRREDQKVLEYEITYQIPYLGISAELELPVKLQIAADLAFSPLVKAKDRDDHILRNKESISKCNGIAILFSADVSHVLFRTKLIEKFFLSAGFDFMYIRTKGEQDQYFYDDDPGTVDNEKGLRIEGINNKIFSTQFGIMLSVGARF